MTISIMHDLHIELLPLRSREKIIGELKVEMLEVYAYRAYAYTPQYSPIEPSNDSLLSTAVRPSG